MTHPLKVEKEYIVKQLFMRNKKKFIIDRKYSKKGLGFRRLGN